MSPRVKEPSVPEAMSLAGDKYVEFVLEQIGKAEERIALMTKAAEVAADRIVVRNGGLLAAGDHGFAMEQIWRSGGFGFCRRYQPDFQINTDGRLESGDAGLEYYRTIEFQRRFFVREAHSDDVVLLGFENDMEEQEKLNWYLDELSNCGALVVLFASEQTSRGVQKRFRQKDNLILISNDVPDGGILRIRAWPEKVCSGRGMVNRLNLWMFCAELISAFLRRGKIPGILLSASYEAPQIWNIPLINSYRFIPALNVVGVEKGMLGLAYSRHLRDIAASIVPKQRAQFRRAATWMAAAVDSGHRVLAATVESLNPVNLPGNPKLFVNYTDSVEYAKAVETIQQHEVALYVGYNWYPTDLAASVDRVGAQLIAAITTIRDSPPGPVDLGEPFVQVSKLDALPQHENHIYIDSKFDQYDGCLKIPGYPIPVLPTSFLSLPIVYWHLVADTIEILEGRRTKR